MDNFGLYWEIGLAHIFDTSAYDHLMFIIALSATYRWLDWDKVIVLLTSFTIGHSLTLAISTLTTFSMDQDWVEALIPLTILFTCVSNLFSQVHTINRRNSTGKYVMAVFFGLIHGLGFSGYLKSILPVEDNVLWPLIAFNLGIEVAQILIVLTFLVITFCALQLAKINRREWVVGVSCFISALAIMMLTA